MYIHLKLCFIAGFQYKPIVHYSEDSLHIHWDACMFHSAIIMTILLYRKLSYIGNAGLDPGSNPGFPGSSPCTYRLQGHEPGFIQLVHGYCLRTHSRISHPVSLYISQYVHVHTCTHCIHFSFCAPIYQYLHMHTHTSYMHAVTLYDCHALASGCSDCVATRGSGFACGWCRDSCEVTDECSTTFAIEGENCPAPVITSITPFSGEGRIFVVSFFESSNNMANILLTEPVLYSASLYSY